MLEEVGILYMSHCDGGYCDMVDQDYMFEVIDMKKWIFSRLRYGV